MRSRDLAIVLPVSQALHCYENCYRFHFLKSSKLSAISVRVQRKPTDWCSFPGRSQQQNNRYTSLVILHKTLLFSLVDLEADFLTEILIFTWDSTVYSVLQQVDVFTGIAKHLFWTANPELQLPEMLELREEFEGDETCYWFVSPGATAHHIAITFTATKCNRKMA